MAPAEQCFDIIVVGAGWNGLISAATYLKLVPEANLVILDEQKSIGGVWSDENIYSNLFAQVGHGFFEYSSKPMRKDGITKQRYIPGTTVNNYLQTFAQEEGLVERIRLGTMVTKVIKDTDGSWKLSLADGSVFSGSKLIYAAGPTAAPSMPDWSRDGFKKPVIHSSEMKKSLPLIEKVDRVTVVGSAKSAFDAVFTLAKMGKQVDWIVRANGTGPLAIAPPTMFGFNTIDLLATRFVAGMSPSILSTPGSWGRFLQNTRLGRICTEGFWRTVTWLSDRHAGYSKSENAEKLRPSPHGIGMFWCNSSLGCASVPGFWDTFHASKTVVHRAEVASLGDTDLVKLEDGGSIATDIVIVCSGYSHNYDTFSEEMRAEYQLPCKQTSYENRTKLDVAAELQVQERFPILGSPPDLPNSATAKEPCHLYRWLISPSMAAKGDRSIYFPGLLHTPFSAFMAEVQALWGCAYLLDMVKLPSLEAMTEEVTLWNAWSRRRYLAQGQKHCYAIYDFLSYADALLGDLGISTTRKGNWITEFVMPYRPRDYRGMVLELVAAQQRRGEMTVEK